MDGVRFTVFGLEKVKYVFNRSTNIKTNHSL